MKNIAVCYLARVHLTIGNIYRKAPNYQLEQSYLSTLSEWLGLYRVSRNRIPNTKTTISQKCTNIWKLNFAHLWRTQLCKSVLLCRVFSWHAPNWPRGELQERILQLYKRLIFIECPIAPFLWRHCDVGLIIWFTLQENSKRFNILSY